MTSNLRSGVIVEIAASAGVKVKDANRKCPIRCPLHDDRTASAFVDPGTNVFFCSICTPGGGWPAKRFAEALNVAWPPQGTFEAQTYFVPPVHTREAPAFTARMAREAWTLARARARDDEFAEADADVYRYLRERGLGEAWEHSLFGVVSPGMLLPDAISEWPSRGYRLIGPLYDSTGAHANVQARSINGSTPKTLFPTGSKAARTVFADARGIEVLCGTWHRLKRVIFGEGLTDFLALSTVSPEPVLCAPGTGMAASAIGPWIEGFEVFIALDCDQAGEEALCPTADNAYRFGARRVRRITWPHNFTDACDVVQRDGLVGLASFLARCLGSSSP